MTIETPGESIFVLHTRWAIGRAAFDRDPLGASPEALAKLRAAERELIAALRARDVAAYVDGTAVHRLVNDYGVERISVSRYPTLHDLSAPLPPARDITYVAALAGLDSDLAAIDAEVR